MSYKDEQIARTKSKGYKQKYLSTEKGKATTTAYKKLRDSTGYMTKWHALHPGKRKEYSNSFITKHPEKLWEYGIKKRGVSIDTYNKLLVEQRGVCAICKNPPLDDEKLVVDHDHTCCSGKKTCGRCVRGLLHSSCNTALGKFNDSIEGLMDAVDYLTRYTEKGNKMSAYREQTTNMNDEACIVDALKDMKFRGVSEGKQVNPEVNQEAKNLEGFHGDKRSQVAEIVINRKEVGASSNDIGFKKGTDGNYTAIISSFDSGFYNEKWMKELKQKYAERKARKIAKSSNLTFAGRTTTPQGKIKLQFKVGI